MRRRRDANCSDAKSGSFTLISIPKNFSQRRPARGVEQAENTLTRANRGRVIRPPRLRDGPILRRAATAHGDFFVAILPRDVTHVRSRSGWRRGGAAM